MHLLPDIFVPRFFAGRRVRKQLSCLVLVPPTDSFCVARVTTRARPPLKAEEKAKMVGNIPQVTMHTSWAASERAVAILSEEAAHFGWHFHVPMKRTRFDTNRYLTMRQEVEPDTARAVDELLAIVDGDEHTSWHDYMHDIGARGRREVYLAQAKRPEIYALGVRVQVLKKPHLAAVA